MYEGIADDADSTLVGDEESIVKLIRKDLTFADASAQVNYIGLFSGTWKSDSSFQLVCSRARYKCSAMLS